MLQRGSVSICLIDWAAHDPHRSGAVWLLALDIVTLEVDPKVVLDQGGDQPDEPSETMIGLRDRGWHENPTVCPLEGIEGHLGAEEERHGPHADGVTSPFNR